MIRLLTLVTKRAGVAPGQRFRLEQWAPILAERHGIELVFEPFESPGLSGVLYTHGNFTSKVAHVLKDGIRRFGVLGRARDFDGVVVYREATLLGGAYLERAIRRVLGLPMIIDFDDVIWEVVNSPFSGRLSLIRAPWKTAAICRMASATTVGNEFLAAYARQYSDNVNIVRTSIDLTTYTPQPPKQGGPFTIVWSGSHSTLAHLETLRPALQEVGARIPTRLRVVCNTRHVDFAGVDNEFVQWSPATEISALGGADVGVMPLPDTPVARGKCGLKALQYMAVSTPVIVSPVGINKEIIVHGENGLLATTTDEWVSALLRMAGDETLRHQLGVAGRRTVEREYSAETSAAAFARVVDAVVPRSKPGRGASM